MRTKVFISYRREDSSAEAGRIYEAVKAELGAAEVFMDVSSISPGAIWPDIVRNKLNEADTVVVVIGLDWFTAGIDDFGQRRIDKPDDWVRLEIENSISNEKKIIPTLVRAAKPPPENALPESIRKLSSHQKVDIRSEYWDHDIQLLLRQIDVENKIDTNYKHSYNIYPRPPEGGSTAVGLSQEKINKVLSKSLPKWKIKNKKMPDSREGCCVEIERTYTFKSFISAIDFMHKVAPGCDIAIHHPRWQNTWKTLTVWLTTWDVRNRVTDRDIQLAKYLDSAYDGFDGKE